MAALVSWVHLVASIWRIAAHALVPFLSGHCAILPLPQLKLFLSALPSPETLEEVAGKRRHRQ
jgi:hypothetical protein